MLYLERFVPLQRAGSGARDRLPHGDGLCGRRGREELLEDLAVQVRLKKKRRKIKEENGHDRGGVAGMVTTTRILLGIGVQAPRASGQSAWGGQERQSGERMFPQRHRCCPPCRRPRAPTMSRAGGQPYPLVSLCCCSRRLQPTAKDKAHNGTGYARLRRHSVLALRVRTGQKPRGTGNRLTADRSIPPHAL